MFGGRIEFLNYHLHLEGVQVMRHKFEMFLNLHCIEMGLSNDDMIIFLDRRILSERKQKGWGIESIHANYLV